jgi:hypothetical protein
MTAMGAVLMFAPVATSMDAGPLVAGFGAGILAIALGLAGTADEGRGTLSLTAQALYDHTLAFALLVLALVFGLEKDPTALAFFGGAGLLTLVVTAVTRYADPRI